MTAFLLSAFLKPPFSTEGYSKRIFLAVPSRQLLVCSLKRDELKLVFFSVQCASLNSNLLPPSLPSLGQRVPYTYMSQEMSQSSIVPLACKVALGSHPGRRDFHSIISASCCIVCRLSLNFSFSAFQLSALENGTIGINIFL